MKKIKQFIYESWLEFKKVRWPSRSELIELTVAVITGTLILAFYVGLVDWIFGFVIGKILP